MNKEPEIKYLGQDDIRDYIMKKDYEIYKLQKELDKTINKKETLKGESDDIYRKYYFDLKERIDKAIEYIENEETYEEGYCDGNLMIYKDRLEYELLNILRGEDNDTI